MILGFAFLLMGSFMDNLRGPLLPQITSLLQLPYAQSSSLIFIGNIAAVVASLLLAMTSHLFSFSQLARFTLLIAICACLLAIPVTTPSYLIVFAIAIGIAVTVMGTLSNIFVMEGAHPNSRARLMAGLHSFYGFGSVLSGIVVAAQSHSQADWRGIFILTAVLLTALLIPWLKKSSIREHTQMDDDHMKGALRREDLLLCLPLTLYVIGEVGCSTWLVTFVTTTQELTHSQGSMLLSAFFAILALTRLIILFVSKPEHEKSWMRISTAAACVFFTLGLYVSPYFLPLTGVFGPFFPIYVSRIREARPQTWQKVSMIGFAMMQAAMAIVHASLGSIVDQLGAALAYHVPLCFLVLAAISTWLNLGTITQKT